MRPISRLSYQGPAIPAPAYSPTSVITDWQVTGPFEQTQDRAATQPSSATWVPFATDARGAVVSGRVVDFHGPKTVAYFRTTVMGTKEETVELHFSTADDLAVWVNGTFASFIARQEAAWFDSATNKAHAGRRMALDLKAGRNDVVVRVRGGVYASGGFFARVVEN